uniref:Arrestin-like N-terminal domain-containing protein n=1 Tax=Panagrolaimus davidi TaxID=227884 RepID=A0A914PE48_9BILA
MQIFTVVLDSASNAYFANTIVNGYIIIRSDKAIKARSIEIDINGQAKASWIHRRGKSVDNYDTGLFYIKSEFLLWTCL